MAYVGVTDTRCYEKVGSAKRNVHHQKRYSILMQRNKKWIFLFNYFSYHYHAVFYRAKNACAQRGTDIVMSSVTLSVRRLFVCNAVNVGGLW